MLIVGGSITFDPAHAEAAKVAATAMVAATLEEPGCQEYSFSIDMADEGKIRVFEVWDSEEDLQAHFQTPHMAVFVEALTEFDIGGRDLVKYQIASSEPM